MKQMLSVDNTYLETASWALKSEKLNFLKRGRYLDDTGNNEGQRGDQVIIHAKRESYNTFPGTRMVFYASSVIIVSHVVVILHHR